MDDASPAEGGEPTATLLVVDDIEENREVLARRMGRRGYTMLTAASGEEALARVTEGGVDLVLLDIMMPGMDGLEVLRRLRDDDASADLPVIMVTAKDEGEDMEQAFELGADDYVAKPVDLAQCLARVKKVLRRRGASSTSATKAVATRADGSTAPVIGSVLAEKYRLDGTLGTGNFGTVYKAHHLNLDRPVAVKVLQTRIADPEALARFESEGRTTVQVQHPNAVEVFDFDMSDGVAYLVMELLDGEPLARDLRRRGRLTPHRAIDLLVPVCKVLEQAHARGLVHRDIKPENIFLHRSKNGDEVVKVLDFGIAKLVGEHVSRENLTAEGFVLGTPAFLAPERLRNQPYDGRSDVYSVGVILYRMLAGRLPFIPQKDDPMALLMMHLKEDPPRPSKFVDDIPEVLERLALDCLAKEAKKRPDASELVQRLQAAGDTLPERPEVEPAGEIDRVDAEAPTHQLDSDRVTRAERAASSGLFSRLVERFFGDTS